MAYARTKTLVYKALRKGVPEPYFCTVSGTSDAGNKVDRMLLAIYKKGLGNRETSGVLVCRFPKPFGLVGAFNDKDIQVQCGAVIL